MAKDLSAAQIAEFQETFQMFDADQSGEISTAELVSFFDLSSTIFFIPIDQDASIHFYKICNIEICIVL
jgi:Ca2+-binding EF-hand superfamily protein